jgi:hypothetical protein
MNILHWCCSRPNILAVTLEFLWVFMSWLHFTFNAVSRVCNLLYSMNWLGCRLFELSAVTSLVLPRDGARLSRKVQRGHLVVPHILWMGPWGSPIMFNNALGCQGQYHFFPFFWDCWSYNHDQCFGFLAKMKWWRHRFFDNWFSRNTNFFQDKLYINNCSKDALKTFNMWYCTRKRVKCGSTSRWHRECFGSRLSDGTNFLAIDINKIYDNFAILQEIKMDDRNSAIFRQIEKHWSWLKASCISHGFLHDYIPSNISS